MRPLLELLVARGTSEDSLPLVRALGAWSEVRATDPALGPPAACFATSPAAPGFATAARRPDIPLAVLVGRADPVAELAGSPIVLCAWSDRMPPEHEPDVVLPRPSVDTAAHPPLPPFVRRRWRRRLGLPDELVLDARTLRAGEANDLRPVPAELAVPLAAVAGAVVVDDPHDALLALALAAPLVADPSVAEELGATANRAMTVADDGALAAAGELANDERRAAVLSAHGRRLAESRFDLYRAARVLAERLGLVREPAPTAGLRRAFLDLDAAPWSSAAQRALMHCTPMLDVEAVSRLGVVAP